MYIYIFYSICSRIIGNYSTYILDGILKSIHSLINGYIHGIVKKYSYYYEKH